MTIKFRTTNAWSKVASIKSLAEHPAIVQFGWLKATQFLIRAIVLRVTTYSCESWLGCTTRLEASHKKMLYSVLGMCEKTKYAAVLLELGMSRICHVMAKLQVSYISQILWVMGGTTVHDLLVAEHKVMGERSTLAMADQLVVKYGMKPISEEYADKTLVKMAIKEISNRELWQECYLSSYVVTRPYLRVTDRTYQRWPKSKTKAILSYRTDTFLGNSVFIYFIACF